MLFYIFYIVRRMRLHLVSKEAELKSLVPGHEEALHRLFGRVSDSKLTIILTAFFLALISYSVPGYLGDSLFDYVFTIVITAIGLLAVSTLAWVYSSSLWGLYRIGKEPLTFKTFYEDGLLGARPIGSLSLSLTTAYFGGVGLLALYILADPMFFTPPLIGFAASLTAIGAVLFFLPLQSTHRTMLQEKKRLQAWLRDRRGQVFIESSAPESEPSELTLERMKRILFLDWAEKRIVNVKTWPLDTQILSRLVVILLSTTAIVIANIIVRVILRL